MNNNNYYVENTSPYQNMNNNNNQIQDTQRQINKQQYPSLQQPQINNPYHNNQGYKPNYQQQNIPVGQPLNSNPYGNQQPVPNQQIYVINAPVDPNFCGICNRLTQSRIQVKAGLGTWLICLGLCFVGLCLCSWIPFIIDDTQDKQFFCCNCGSLKGEKKLIK